MKTLDSIEISNIKFGYEKVLDSDCDECYVFRANVDNIPIALMVAYYRIEVIAELSNYKNLSKALQRQYKTQFISSIMNDRISLWGIENKSTVEKFKQKYKHLI